MSIQRVAILSNADDLLWRRERSHMVSSVTGELIEGQSLPSGYWSANLVQRVLFNTAVARIGTDELFSDVTNIIETEEELKLFAPLGCGFQTGAATVENVARANEKDRVAVIGLGGVGLVSIMVRNYVQMHAEQADLF